MYINLAINILQELENEGNWRQAEIYYVEAGDWKAGVNMYRAQDMWDEAHRVSFWCTLKSSNNISLLNMYGDIFCGGE